jgi:hypothetical protein
MALLASASDRIALQAQVAEPVEPQAEIVVPGPIGRLFEQGAVSLSFSLSVGEPAISGEIPNAEDAVDVAAHALDEGRNTRRRRRQHDRLGFLNWRRAARNPGRLTSWHVKTAMMACRAIHDKDGGPEGLEPVACQNRSSGGQARQIGEAYPRPQSDRRTRSP